MRFNLLSVDLNLLKAFDALERDRSVTKAAARLHVGQPALSHALSRLRALTSDRLFVRGPGGMMPTPRALKLIGPVRDSLAQIENTLFGSESFDPATARHAFRIGMSDFGAAAVVPRLSRTLSRIAPGMSLSIHNADRSNAAAKLDNGAIDLAIGFFPHCATWHRKERLFEEDHLCVFHPKQVKATRPISLKDFLNHAHVLVRLQGEDRGFVDDILDKRKLQRKVMIASPYFLLAGYLLHQLPMIAVLPRHYAELCAMTCGLVASPLPFPTPSYEVSMLWRSRDESNTSLAFLRQTLSDAFSGNERPASRAGRTVTKVLT
jgi:LysR family transcriptional regulator, mexEF-oprN operon transcriptional activator